MWLKEIRQGRKCYKKLGRELVLKSQRNWDFIVSAVGRLLNASSKGVT